MTGSKVRSARLAFLDKIHLAPPRDEVTEDIILWETTHFSLFSILPIITLSLEFDRCDVDET